MNGAISIPRREFWAAVVLTLCWLGFTAGLRPLQLPDEGRYVGVAWEALRSGEWWVPTLNGLPFFHKPPLFYWITELSMSVLGVNAWAARMAPLLGGAMGALSLFWLSYRWQGPRQARAALLVLLAMPLHFAGSQFANLDMLVAGCISATIAFGADFSMRHQRGLPYRRPLAAAFACAGLGILAKGLIGLVLPGLVLLGWLLMRRQWRTLMALPWWPGILLLLCIAAPWFVLMQHRYPEFLHYFFVVQHMHRFAGEGFNNVQPFWFFPVVLAVANLPALPWLWRGWRLASWRTHADVHPLSGLMALWLAVVVVFFSLPQSKLVGYIFPALPPLAWLVAEAWGRLTASGQNLKRWAWVSLGIGAFIGLAAVAAYSLGAARTHKDLAHRLAELRGHGEPVVMLERFDYDIPLYARLTEPVVVVEDWNDSALMSRDSWRKELGDTRLFAPKDMPSPTFLTRDTLRPMLCMHRAAWIVGAEEVPRQIPWLAKARPVMRQGGSVLWQVEAATLGCLPAGAAR